jgi:transposase
MTRCTIHRIRFVYLPKHTSWLNQIEIVFGIVACRLQRGNFLPIWEEKGLQSDLRRACRELTLTLKARLR